MTRKSLIIFLLCLAAVSAATIWYGVYYRQTRERENKPLPTNRAGYAVEESVHADSLIVGKWQNATNSQWYKVYYDDFDEERQLFWGKEWNEEEEVFEEDLNFHGNGWFRWERKGNILYEYATMDARDVPIHLKYKIQLSTPDTLVYYDTNRANILLHFSRVR